MGPEADRARTVPLIRMWPPCWSVRPQTPARGMTVRLWTFGLDERPMATARGPLNGSVRSAAKAADDRRTRLAGISLSGPPIADTMPEPAFFLRTGRRFNRRGRPACWPALFQPSSYLGLFMFLALTGLRHAVARGSGARAGRRAQQPGHPATRDLRLPACILGTLAGDSMTYAIGYHWGRNLVEAHPRLSKLLHAENGKRFEAAVNNHAFKVMLISRFIIGVRASVYLTAGVVRIPYRRFLMYDVVCVSVMVSTVFLLAYMFGDDVLSWVRRAEWTRNLRS